MFKKSKNHKRMLFAVSLSTLGNALFDYVNTVFITSFPNSIYYLAIYQNIEFVINIIFSPIGGVLGDKFNKKFILVFVDLISALACTLGLFFLRTEKALVYILLLNAILAIITCFYFPVIKSYPKEILYKNEIEIFNSNLSIFQEISRVISPVLGLFLYKYFSIELIYIINIITFVMTGIIEFTTISIIESSISDSGNTKVSFNAFQFFKENLSLKNIVLNTAIFNFFLSGYNLTLPYLVREMNNFYAIILFSESIGTIIGGSLFTKISHKISLKNSVKFCGLSIISSIIIFSIGEQIFQYISLIGFMLFGFFLTIFSVGVTSYFQKTIDSSIISRFWGWFSTIIAIFMPFGGILFSIINQEINEELSLLLIGLSIFLLSTVILEVEIE